jgi:bis(5'-nucleosyl)-tetraphosphatase (symmetrical)
MMETHAQDKLWLTGDLVNRGPDSLETVRMVRELGNSVITVLGNHDLHFLAVAERIRRNRRGDTLKKLVKSSEMDEIVQWFRKQPLVHCDPELKTIMVHAGVYPGWSRKNLERYAREVEKKIRGDNYSKLLRRMYGRSPRRWSDDLNGWDRRRFIINACTRLRYCDRKGNTNFTQKGPPGSQPKRYIPWFRHPGLKCRKWRIVFGHWSSLGYMQKGNVISLDSGCVWGGKLTAVRLDGEYKAPRQRVKC